MDAAAPASHLEYKLVSCSKREQDTIEDNYPSHITNQSITSGSSNHTELIRAYEFGRRFHDQSQGGRCKVLFYGEQEDEYNNESIISDETPTDPGIRRFTKSPPRPNETRTAACFAGGLKVMNHESADDDDDDDDEDGEQESVQVEDVESDSESVLTASPACSEAELSSPSTPTNEHQPADTFSAIPRARGRHPSWAQARMNNLFKHQRKLKDGRELDLVVREGLSSDNESIDRLNHERNKKGRVEEDDEGSYSSSRKGRRKSNSRIIPDAKNKMRSLASEDPCPPPVSFTESSSCLPQMSSSVSGAHPSYSSPPHLMRNTVTHFESSKYLRSFHPKSTTHLDLSFISFL